MNIIVIGAGYVGVITLSVFIAVATLGLSYFLLPRMGIMGTGIAWLASQGIAALIIVYNLRRGYIFKKVFNNGNGRKINGGDQDEVYAYYC